MAKIEWAFFNRTSTIDSSGGCYLTNQHELDIKTKSWEKIKGYAQQGRYKSKFGADMVIFHGIVSSHQVDIKSAVYYEKNCVDGTYHNCLFQNNTTLEWYIIRPN